MKITKTRLLKVLATLKPMNFKVTRNGNTYPVFDVTDCEAFWEMWRADKEQCKALGCKVTTPKYSGIWLLEYIADYDMSKKVSVARSRANLVKARAVKAAKVAERKTQAALTRVSEASSREIEEALNYKPRAKVAEPKQTLSVSEVLELVRAGYTKAEIEAMAK